MARGIPFVDLRLLGDKKLDRKLRSLDVKMQRKFARRALREAWKPVKDAAKANALAIARRPAETGIMRRVARALKVRAIAKSRIVGGRRRAIRGRRGMIGFTFRTPTRAELGIPAGSKWYPPAHIELGTRRTPPLSYMRKAFLEHAPRARRRIVSAIWSMIRGEARSG